MAKDKETPVDNTQLIMMAAGAANAAESDPRLADIAKKLLGMVFDDDTCKLQMLLTFTQAQQGPPAGARTPSQIRAQIDANKAASGDTDALKKQLHEAIDLLAGR